MVWKSNRYVFFEMFSLSYNFAISKKSSTFALAFDRGGYFSPEKNDYLIAFENFGGLNFAL